MSNLPNDTPEELIERYNRGEITFTEVLEGTDSGGLTGTEPTQPGGTDPPETDTTGNSELRRNALLALGAAALAGMVIRDE